MVICRDLCRSDGKLIRRRGFSASPEGSEGRKSGHWIDPGTLSKSNFNLTRNFSSIFQLVYEYLGLMEREILRVRPTMKLSAFVYDRRVCVVFFSSFVVPFVKARYFIGRGYATRGTYNRDNCIIMTTKGTKRRINERVARR